jgi:hypothetical protein
MVQQMKPMNFRVAGSDSLEGIGENPGKDGDLARRNLFMVGGLCTS